jgi:hypothetical protein
MKAAADSGKRAGVSTEAVSNIKVWSCNLWGAIWFALRCRLYRLPTANMLPKTSLIVLLARAKRGLVANPKVTRATVENWAICGPSKV